MIVKVIEDRGLIGKLYYNKLGYSFKIFYNKKVVAISYTYLSDRSLCEDKLNHTMQTIDIEKARKLK